MRRTPAVFRTFPIVFFLILLVPSRLLAQPKNLRILSDPEFAAGKLSTSFMDRFLSRPRSGRLAEAV